ncbi:conserved hypothetical protein [uncultured spirochete]|jgi:hypothetical protein|uniref:DUF2764 family protein n=1 Tax=uncultured spirochete TaxID=156406 RepID=A0A3P3XU03_9SPIR|nr:conserved hypothetical protein [uncultured spirochete]
MKRYWYFASTLTSFPFGAPPPISVEEFDVLCSRLVEKDEMEFIRHVEEVRTGEYSDCIEKSSFLKAYFEWERGVRNALVMLRARANKWDAEQWTRPGSISADALQAAQTVYAASNPLQAELAFEHERWDAIERLSSLSAFELDSILAYKMKLLIATRCVSFDKERGREGFKVLYQDIMNAAAGAASSALDTGVAT